MNKLIKISKQSAKILENYADFTNFTQIAYFHTQD